MNSRDRDRDLLDMAMGLISNVDAACAGQVLDEAWPQQTVEWREVARRFLDGYARIGGHTPEQGLHRDADGNLRDRNGTILEAGPALQSRWRDIDPAGAVSTAPTPDPPDDPDEGETGPPEQQS